MREPEPWVEYQRRRWLRPDAARFMQPDAERWRKPQFPALREMKARAEADALHAELSAMRSACLAMRRKLAEIRLSLALRRALKYSPDQPRVPAGNPDGGQWTNGGGVGTRVRLAAADRPRLGRAALAALAAQAAFQLIEKFRKDNFLFDLFGTKERTVATTTVGDVTLTGTNSGTADYDDGDDHVAKEYRDLLIQKYPEVMKADKVGQKPNDALFHAEATVLLRAARLNGGTPTGKTLEVFVDRSMCSSCPLVLPLLGQELGNPTVSFVEKSGARRAMRDGRWVN